jgi:hypothetical protein
MLESVANVKCMFGYNNAQIPALKYKVTAKSIKA